MASMPEYVARFTSQCRLLSCVASSTCQFTTTTTQTPLSAQPARASRSSLTRYLLRLHVVRQTGIHMHPHTLAYTHRRIVRPPVRVGLAGRLAPRGCFTAATTTVRVTGTHRIHGVCVTEVGGGHRVDGSQQRRHQRRHREPTHVAPWNTPELAQRQGSQRCQRASSAARPRGASRHCRIQTIADSSWARTICASAMRCCARPSSPLGSNCTWGVRGALV